MIEKSIVLLLFLAALSSGARADFRDEGTWSHFPVMEPLTRVNSQREHISSDEEKQKAIKACLDRIHEEHAIFQVDCAKKYGRFESSGKVINSLTGSATHCRWQCVTENIPVGNCYIKKYLIQSTKKQFFQLYRADNDYGVFRDPIYLEEDASEPGAIAKLMEMAAKTPTGRAACFTP
jgi:hypothetical protein